MSSALLEPDGDCRRTRGSYISAPPIISIARIKIIRPSSRPALERCPMTRKVRGIFHFGVLETAAHANTLARHCNAGRQADDRAAPVAHLTAARLLHSSASLSHPLSLPDHFRELSQSLADIYGCCDLILRDHGRVQMTAR